MAWIDLYAPVHGVHLTAVTLSLSLFALRGASVLAGRDWPMAPAARYASVAIDMLLLAAGATLWALLGLNPARDLWLGAKLALLLAYIVPGSLALKRARSARGRAICYFAELACAGSMVSIAICHHPAGRLAAPGLGRLSQAGPR